MGFNLGDINPELLLNLQAFGIALAITFVLVPVIRKWAIASGHYDAPGERKIHKYPVPRLGGVAIWLGFMLALGIIALLKWETTLGAAMPGILLGGLIIFILGLLDDLKNLSPYVKLAVQFIAALTAFSLGVEVTSLDLPGSLLLILNALSLPVTVLWIVGLANSLNFIDGIDGLAGGVTVLSALTLAVIATFTDQPSAALLASLLAGASLGFLAFNFHPARIFMGDSGALFCGFLLACISITGVLKTKVVVMLLPLCILCVPILDITYSTFRRLLRGQSPFKADADHLHHQFLKAGMTQIKAVTYFYSACIIGGLITVIYVNKAENYLPIYLGLLAGLLAIGTLLVLGVRKFYPLEDIAETPQPVNPEGQA